MSSVDLHVEGPLARVHLNNPAKLNAFTPDMLRQLEAHCDRIEEDVSIRGVLVTAEGERAFCAGADIIGWGALSPTEFARHWVRLGHRVFDRLARLSRPTIAVMQGHAFGGGLELATLATSASWRRGPRWDCLRRRSASCRVGRGRSGLRGCCRSRC
jgi:enoyl-CoA hydratase